MYIRNVYASFLIKTVASHNVTDASILIIWLNFAKIKNAALNIQINIVLKNALCWWIKDNAWTAIIIMNSEDVHVSSEKYKQSNSKKSFKIDWSNIQKY